MCPFRCSLLTPPFPFQMIPFFLLFIKLSDFNYTPFSSPTLLILYTPLSHSSHYNIIHIHTIHTSITWVRESGVFNQTNIVTHVDFTHTTRWMLDGTNPSLLKHSTIYLILQLLPSQEYGFHSPHSSLLSNHIALFDLSYRLKWYDSLLKRGWDVLSLMEPFFRTRIDEVESSVVTLPLPITITLGQCVYELDWASLWFVIQRMVWDTVVQWVWVNREMR